MTSPSKPGSAVELANLGGKKGSGASGGSDHGTASGKTTTTFSGMKVRMSAKGMQVNTNENGHKTSFRATANTTKLQSGSDQLAFNAAKGTLSIKTGDTHFTLSRGKDGLSMSATDLKSKTKAGFSVKGNEVTRTLDGPKKSTKTVTQNSHLGALAAKHSARMGEIRSPLSKFGGGPFDGSGADKSDKNQEFSFSAFQRETKTKGGKSLRKDVFRETSVGANKKRGTSAAADTSISEEMDALASKRKGPVSPSFRGRSHSI